MRFCPPMQFFPMSHPRLLCWPVERYRRVRAWLWVKGWIDR